MKISAFCLTTNTIEFGYPFIESIKSWLPLVDELVVIDGGSTDGTIEKIQQIGDNKIRIISDENTRWEKDWYYSRMGKNFNRGFHECTGDIIIKFDVDYVLHEEAYTSKELKYNLRYECTQAIERNNLTISFIRLNFGIIDRYFFKKQKTLAVSMPGVKKRNIPVDYGLDLGKWAWGYEPIVPDNKENGLIFGSLINAQGNYYSSNVKVFNYGFSFSTEDQIRKIRQRHMKAESRQQSLKYTQIDNSGPKYALDFLENNPNRGLEVCKKDTKNYVTNRPQIKIRLEDHPKVMHDLIKNLKPDQYGYNLFGEADKADYYK